jgi:LacI family transcriptional regulator
MGAVRALHELELQHEIALVGFDEIDMADALDPGISLIPQQPSLIGRTAAQVLFERLDGDTSPARQIVLEHRVVERGSGEIPAPSLRSDHRV